MGNAVKSLGSSNILTGLMTSGAIAANDKKKKRQQANLVDGNRPTPPTKNNYG